MPDEQIIMDRMAELPSPPIIIQTLFKKIAEKDVSCHELARIIETDQAFTARVLRLVNSPFYGFARKIMSVEEAITMLGTNSIHQLLLTTSILNAYRSEGNRKIMEKFWMHSFAVGMLARKLLPRVNLDTRNEAFVCGILHDIGRLAFMMLDQERFHQVYFEESTISDLEIERKFFGDDHQHIGSLMASKWNFPPSICEVIGHHHEPNKINSHKTLVSAVYIADLICHALRIGNSGTFYVSEFYPESWHILNLDYFELENILKMVLKDIDNLMHMLRELSR